MSVVSSMLSLAAKVAPFCGPEGMVLAPILGTLATAEPLVEQGFSELHELLQTKEGQTAIQQFTSLLGHFASHDPDTGAVILSPNDRNDPSSSSFYGN